MPAVPVYLKTLVTAIEEICEEGVADIAKVENLCLACCQTPLYQAWPRRFTYQVERLLGPGDLPNSLQPQPPSPGNPLLYVSAWKLTPILLSALEFEGWQITHSSQLLVRLLTNPANANRANSPHSPVEIAPLLADTRVEIGSDCSIYLFGKEMLLADNPIQAFLAYVEEEPAGIVQAIRFTARTGYLIDLFTRPAFRQRGVGSALLHFIHDRFSRPGVRQMVVIPTRMTRQSGFYLNLDYRPAAEIGTFIPNESKPRGRGIERLS